MDDVMKFQIRIPMRCDTPNHNGTVYTKESIEKFLDTNTHNIIVRHNNRPIGYTAGWDNIEYDGNSNIRGVTLGINILDNIEPDILVKEMSNNEVMSFEIRSINITKQRKEGNK